jgi:hypothetical protein
MSTGDEEKAGESGFGARFISGLKDLILEDDKPDRPSATGKKLSDASPSTSALAADASARLSARPVSSSDSPMAASLLEQVLGRSTAFTALNDAIKPLEEIITDEMTRYRAAFAIIKKNRSLDQVVQAIDLQHMQILEEEVTRFASQTKQKEATDIDVLVAEAKTLKDNVQAAAQQIVKLREETENRILVVEGAAQRDRTRVEEIDRELLEKRQAIALVANQFNSAVASVKDSLQQSKAKILKYLSN